jgi:hypothetical protein
MLLARKQATFLFAAVIQQMTKALPGTESNDGKRAKAGPR